MTVPGGVDPNLFASLAVSYTGGIRAPSGIEDAGKIPAVDAAGTNLIYRSLTEIAIDLAPMLPHDWQFEDWSTPVTAYDADSTLDVLTVDLTDISRANETWLIVIDIEIVATLASDSAHVGRVTVSRLCSAAYDASGVPVVSVTSSSWGSVDQSIELNIVGVWTSSESPGIVVGITKETTFAGHTFFIQGRIRKCTEVKVAG